MAFCSNCGVKNIDSAKFCEACGSVLVTPTSSELTQQVHKSTPSLAQKNVELTENNAGSSDKGFFASVYAALFLERDIKKLWEAWLILTLVDAAISFGMERLGIYSPPVDLNLAIVWAVLLAVFIIPVRIAIVKNNANIALGVLICIAGLFLWDQTQEDTRDAYELAFNVLLGNGYIKSKIYLSFLIFWDQFFSTIFECILLYRIYLSLKSQRNK